MNGRFRISSIYMTKNKIFIRERKTSGGMMLDAHSKANGLDIFNQTGKNTSSISDLSSGKNLYNLPISTKVDNQFGKEF